MDEYDFSRAEAKYFDYGVSYADGDDTPFAVFITHLDAERFRNSISQYHPTEAFKVVRIRHGRD